MVLFFGNNGDFAWSWELVRQLLVENASCWSYYWWTIECFSACSLSDSLLSSLPPWVLYVFVALFWSALTVSSFLSFCCVCFASLYVRPKTCIWDCLLQVDGDNPWLMSDHSGRVWQGCPIFWKLIRAMSSSLRPQPLRVTLGIFETRTTTVPLSHWTAGNHHSSVEPRTNRHNNASVERRGSEPSD